MTQNRSGLSPEQLQTNFADVKPALTVDAAMTEANRCLYCYDAPCTHACPTHIDVPEFIRRIASRNTLGAARVIFESNPMGASCARVCPTEDLCEGACVYHKLQMPPIDIGRLQRFATDHAIRAHAHVLTPAAEQKPYRVAIIGSGPSGLSCAAQLGLLGIRAVVFEAAPEAGGLNRYGIAPYKMTNDEAREEVAYLRDMTGFHLRTGVRVGTDVSLAELERDFDAIYLAVGLGGTRRLEIPGEDLDGVHGATEFIQHLRSHPFEDVKVGRRVAVIGCGNTAIDAATEAKRLGAEEVTIVYRRGEAEMPCYPYEYDLAKRDAVRFLWYTRPVAIIGEKSVDGLLCERMTAGPPDASGRATPIPVNDSTFTLVVDMVIKASGQSTQEALFGQIEGLKIEKGKVVVSADGQTGNPRYFAGGDCVSGGQEVVNAAAEGKAAAEAIARYLESKSKVEVG